MFKAKSVALAIAATLGVTSFSANAAFFYAADGAKGIPGQLYLVSSTGGGFLIPLASLSEPIHGLAFDGSGTLFGITTQQTSPTNRLVSIDPATGTVTVISTASQNRMTDMAFHSGTMYVATRGGLSSIDTTTGVRTSIGGNSWAVASNGVDLFDIDSGNTVRTIDPATGATLTSGTIVPNRTGRRWKSATFDDTNTLYATDGDPNGTESQLKSIDTSNIAAGATATQIMSLPNTITGMVAVPSASADGDTIPDAIEPVFGLNPATNDGAGDLDSDGLTNADELLIYGSLPNDADTDDDGLTDGVEVTLGTSLTLADTDADGVSDGGEVALDKDPLVADDYGLNPVELTTARDDPEHFDVKTDAAGNFHMVWDDNNRALVYRMSDPDGALLIADTVLSTRSLAPKIVPTTNGRFFVVSHDNSGNDGGQLYLRIIDPAAAAQDGSAADPATLVTTADKLLAASATHPFALADNSDNLWVFYQGGAKPGTVDFQKIQPDGTVAIAATTLDPASIQNHSNITAAVDSQNRIHVAYRHANGTSKDELYYTLMANDGTALIAPTLITADDGFDSVWPNLLIGPNDVAYVVWGDRGPNASTQDGLDGELMFMTLDPSLDDLDGSAATLATIQTVADTLVSVNDGVHSWYPRSVLRNGIITTVTSNTLSYGNCSNREVFKIDPASPAPGTGYKFNTADCDGNTQTIDGRIAGDSVFVRQEGADGFERIVAFRDLLGARATDTATGTGTVSMSSDEGLVTFIESLAVTDLPAAAQASLPAGEVFPDGYLNFVVNGVTPGATVNVTLDLPKDRSSFKYFKYTAAGGWVQYPNIVQGASASQYVITVTDGGAGDGDGIANGQIVDPGGLAGPVVGAAVGGGGGGGCTLNPERKDPFFPLMLATAALFWLRRKLGFSARS